MYHPLLPHESHTSLWQSVSCDMWIAHPTFPVRWYSCCFSHTFIPNLPNNQWWKVRAETTFPGQRDNTIYCLWVRCSSNDPEAVKTHCISVTWSHVSSWRRLFPQFSMAAGKVLRRFHWCAILITHESVIIQIEFRCFTFELFKRLSYLLSLDLEILHTMFTSNAKGFSSPSWYFSMPHTFMGVK